MNKQLLQNVLWIFKLHIKHAPVISLAQIIGFINNNTNRLLQGFVIGLVIDWIIKYVNGPQDNNLVIYSMLAFGIYYLVSGSANIAANFGRNLINFRMGYAVPEILLQEKLDKLSISELENPETQNLINRYRENRNTFASLGNYLFTLIGVVFSFVVAIIPLVSVLPLATLLVIIVSIPTFLLNRKIINELWELDKETTVMNRKSGSITGMLNSPAALKEIKLLSAFKYLQGYFTEYIDKYFGKKIKIYTRWTAYDFFSTVITNAVILFGIFNLISLAQSKAISIGQIAFYITALTGIGSYIDNFAANLASLGGTVKRISDCKTLLDLPEYDAKGKIIIDELKTPPSILLKNVGFTYPNGSKKIIEALNLEIKAGEKIAIVGENGAGKTTLVKLLSNIYPVTEGDILINGQNLQSIDAESWFKNLGVLYQDYNTYDDLTVRENVALGSILRPINEAEVKASVEKSDALGFIEEFPNQFEQILSERYEGGIRPSTGQWQKIAIARFFYRNAPILILDEPTASIDAVSEANIFDRIYKFIENKTVIIISHRFATVRNADRIIVFDKGKIIEEGSHAELMSLDGKYANAFRLQAKGYN